MSIAVELEPTQKHPFFTGNEALQVINRKWRITVLGNLSSAPRPSVRDERMTAFAANNGKRNVERCLGDRAENIRPKPVRRIGADEKTSGGQSEEQLGEEAESILAQSHSVLSHHVRGYHHTGANQRAAQALVLLRL